MLIFFYSLIFYVATSKGQHWNRICVTTDTQRWQCHKYFLIRIYSTCTITRRRSQGLAPGLSLSIMLTLSMCGTKISQGKTPARYHLPSILIWGRCNLKRSRRTVICLPVYKISSLRITPPKTPNSGQFSYPLPNIVSFLFEKKNRLEFRFRSPDFSFNLFPVWQLYCWRFWSAIVTIHTSTINAPRKAAYNLHIYT